MVLGAFLPATGPDAPSAARAVLTETDRVYALVETQSGANDLAASARSLGYTPQATIRLDGLGLLRISVDLPAGFTGIAAINTLEAAVPSSTVGANHTYRVQLGHSGSERRTYANQVVRWPDGGCPAKARVGLIDTGIDASAPALATAAVQTRNFSGNSTSSKQHGTEVASILADPTRLRAVSLFGADVMALGPDGEDLGGAAELVQALNWMAAQNVRLVNISLAGPPNKLLAQAVGGAHSSAAW